MPDYEAGLEPTPLPEGAYQFTVLDANEKRSQGGNTMIELQLLVKGPNGDELRVYDHLVFVKNMSWKIDHFRAATGETVVAGPASLEALDCIDRTGRALLTTEKFQGREQNKIADYIDPSAEKPPPAKAKNPFRREETIEEEVKRKGAENNDDIPMK